MPSGISPGGRPIDESPLSASKTDNWVARNGGLPPYVRGIARGIAKRHGGQVTSADIAAAWQYVKRLAIKSKHPAIKAAASKAVGQEVVLRARAHSHANEHNGNDYLDFSSEGDSAMAGNLANFGGKRAKPFGQKTADDDAKGLRSDAKKLLKRAKFSGNPGNNSDTKKLPPKQSKQERAREALNFAKSGGKETDLASPPKFKAPNEDLPTRKASSVDRKSRNSNPAVMSGAELRRQANAIVKAHNDRENFNARTYSDGSSRPGSMAIETNAGLRKKAIAAHVRGSYSVRDAYVKEAKHRGMRVNGWAKWDAEHEHSNSNKSDIDLAYEGFNALKGQLAAKGASDPGALAAWIGRRKYGVKKFDKAAGKGAKLGHKSKGGKGKK